jgi:tetraacyldisaccharide 4'-kinase
VPARVLSVGNLAAGGTGKTPLVARVAGRLMAMGRRVAILTRGYGRSRRGLAVLGPGETEAEWRRIGDEPALLHRILPAMPMVIAADRVAGAQEAIRRFQADTLILDDGFQHRWLARDLDVVLLDALRPWGNGHLLPRGLLREPPAALARAHLVLLTSGAPADWEAVAARVALWARGVPVAGAVRVPKGWYSLGGGDSEGHVPPEGLAGARAVAFAGIAQPERFREMAGRLGLEIAAFLPFPDHHPYMPSDLVAIAAAARQHRADLAVTTEKDAIRLAGLPLPAGLSFRVLRIAMDVVWNAPLFWDAVAGQSSRFKT